MSKQILNPTGNPPGARKAAQAARRQRGRRPVIGLLNNSKPNVAFFLEAIERRLRGQVASYETVSVVKPRSAGPSPDIELLAARCDYVINAVAD